MEESKKSQTVTSQVVEFVKSNIISGQFPSGSRLPPVRQLAKMTGVSNYPVQAAIAILNKQKVVNSVRGSGVYVSKDAFAMLSSGLLKIPVCRNIAVVSAFLFHEGGVFVEHNATVKGLFEECRELRIRPTLLSPFVNLDDKDETVNEIVAGKFDGVLWLYPKHDHLKSVRAVAKAGIPIVVTSHEPLELNIPSVEENEYDAAKKIRKLFESNGCKKIKFFYLSSDSSFPTIYNNYDDSFEIEMIRIPYSGDNYRMELKKRLTPDKKGLGVFLVNNRDLRLFLSDSPDELFEMLKNHTVIFTSEESVYEHIKPLCGKINMSVVIHSFSSMGKLAVQKLSVVLEGKLENTTTLVPLEWINTVVSSVH